MSSEPETLRLAVVDDELGIRLGVTSILSDVTVEIPEVGSRVRLQVSSWADGESFLAALDDTAPQIVLLDSKLPGIGGMEILEGTLSARPDVVTIMITAYATLESAVRATKLGAYDFLAKPFTPEELRVTVRKAIHHHVLAAQARRLMEENRRMRFQFISVLAHELKSPINAVDGYLDLIRNRLLGDDLAAYSEMIERSSLRIGGMRKLINDLLDLTRVESGQRVRTLEPLDLSELARAALDGQENAARAMELSLDLVADPGLTLQADRMELEMILNNLVSNAVKYNRPGGRVTVRLARRDGAAELEVADTGWGLSREEADRLFADFVRIKNDHTRDIPGSGLGLSLVKKLCALYGGSVTVESEPKVGSTFRVRLPL
jgi:two-component system, sensor histidine kinase and response regulator